MVCRSRCIKTADWRELVEVTDENRTGVARLILQGLDWGIIHGDPFSANARITSDNHVMWLNRSATPPFYPNAVTLTDVHDHQAPLAGIHELLAARIPGAWAVKDSF